MTFSLALASSAPFYLNPTEHRAWAEIDLNAIAHNVRSIRTKLTPNKGLIAVIKANAYWVGAEAVARTALANGATALAVATCDEGVALRQSGLTTCPIIVLSYMPPALADDAVAADLTVTVNQPALAYALSQAALRQKKRVKVHFKLETGLNRYGLHPQDALALAKLVQNLPGLQMQGIYTHFATGDEGDTYHVLEQVECFKQIRSLLNQHGFYFEQEHLCNSAAAISMPEARVGTLRMGLAVLGYYPSEVVAEKAASIGLNLQPCLTVKSLVARLSWLEAGEAVGYNRTYIAQNKTRLALVPIGYADGVRRALSNKGAVLIRGQRAPIVGRISMDQFSVDVTNIPDVVENDEVVIVGQQANAVITLEEVAAQCDTISYEILTGFGQRIKRVYF